MRGGWESGVCATWCSNGFGVPHSQPSEEKGDCEDSVTPHGGSL